jgi:ABC-type dipeptide/oligopeptide/nickel transport system ATPase component
MVDKIYIAIDDKKIEAKGEQLEYIISAQKQVQETTRLLEAEQQAKEEARQSAMDKLKKLGLTEEEIAALVP